MKTKKMHEPTASRGAHQKMDAGEQSAMGSTGPEVKGKTKVRKGGGEGQTDYTKTDDADMDDYGPEYDENGNKKNGGGYYMKAGKLYKMPRMDKSTLEVSDLQKSLDRLDEFASEEDSSTRKDDLLTKALVDELSDEENAELIQLMGGGEEIHKSASLAEEVTEPLKGEDLQKSLDVSDYLEEQHSGLLKSLTVLSEAVERSDHRQHEFGILLSKAVRAIGEAVQTNRETLDALGNQVPRGPKSQFRSAKPKVLEKSFAGQEAQETLSKSQIFDGLDALFKSSVENNMGGRLATGEDLQIEIAKFESTGMLSPNVLRAVQEQRQRAAH